MSYYRERMAPSWWMILSAGLLMPITFLVLVPLNPGVGLIMGAFFWVSSVWAMWVFSPNVILKNRQLRAGRATLELEFVKSVEVYRGAEARHQKGAGAHGLTWFCIRPWIDPVVKIKLKDPKDPTPYWIVSSRKPERLSLGILASQREHS